METGLELKKKNKSFGGFVQRYSHKSQVLQCDMLFTVYLPPKVFEKNGVIGAQIETKVPALYFLSGLTCTDENFIQKSGAQKYAAENGIALICPDTSPRGVTIEGLANDWDFGFGAGFYVNATEEKFAKNFNMYDYIVKELPKLVEANLPVTNVKSIFGHSMGGKHFFNYVNSLILNDSN